MTTEELTSLLVEREEIDARMNDIRVPLGKLDPAARMMVDRDSARRKVITTRVVSDLERRPMPPIVNLGGKPYNIVLCLDNLNFVLVDVKTGKSYCHEFKWSMV